MSHPAKGPFEVKLVPQKADNPQAEKSGHGRMSIDKHFHGDLEGTSQGEMLSIMTTTKGSAAYVAIEKVTGKLAGREGTFALQHSATMNRGVPSLAITVIPDSGTGALEGLAGSMKIIIEPDGKHFYEMEYALPASE
jgi:Protein of unknown function (DUF3224)